MYYTILLVFLVFDMISSISFGNYEKLKVNSYKMKVISILVSINSILFELYSMRK